MAEKLNLPELPASSMFIGGNEPMTIEWQEFFRALFERVGGTSGPNSTAILLADVGRIYSTPINYAKRINELEKQILTLSEPINYEKRIIELEEQLQTIDKPKSYIKEINALELAMFALPTGSIPIVMPGVSTDNAIVRWDGATGNKIQNSLVIVSDTGGVVIPNGLTIGSVGAPTAILIEVDGDLVLINRLGMGITPAYDFHVHHADEPTFFLQDTTNDLQIFFQAGDTIGRIGTVSAHDFRIQSNSTDRIWVSSAGIVRVGTAANYTQYAANGLQTMAGTARVHRHVRVSAASWKPGATAPTPSRLSVFPTLIFVSGDDAHYSLICPFRMAAGTAIQVYVDFTHRDAVDIGTAEWTLEYNNVDVGELITGATTSISGISGATAEHELTRVKLTTGIVGAVAHDAIGMILSHTGGGTIGVNVDLVDVHFEFIMDKLGEPT